MENGKARSLRTRRGRGGLGSTRVGETLLNNAQSDPFRQHLQWSVCILEHPARTQQTSNFQPPH